MKRILAIIAMVFLFTGCVNLFPKYTTYENIDYDTFMKKIENKESFVLLVWQTGCEYCEMFEPTLNKVIKEHEVKIYGINLRELEQEQGQIVTNKTLTKGTPALVYFKDGKNELKLNGRQSEEKVINFLKRINYIKE